MFKVSFFLKTNVVATDHSKPMSFDNRPKVLKPMDDENVNLTASDEHEAKREANGIAKSLSDKYSNDVYFVVSGPGGLTRLSLGI